MATGEVHKTSAELKSAADKAADDKAAADKAADEKADERKPARRGALAPAGESGDPAVQKLLADRQAHVSNAGLEPDPAQEAVKKAAVEAIAAIDEQLADLGFTAK